MLGIAQGHTWRKDDIFIKRQLTCTVTNIWEGVGLVGTDKQNNQLQLWVKDFILDFLEDALETSRKWDTFNEARGFKIHTSIYADMSSTFSLIPT